MLKNPLLKSIKFYQQYLSRLMLGSCKFKPTCSQYIYNAIEEWGVIKGIFLGIKRLLRCNPCSKGELI